MAEFTKEREIKGGKGKTPKPVPITHHYKGKSNTPIYKKVGHDKSYIVIDDPDGRGALSTFIKDYNKPSSKEIIKTLSFW